MPANNNYILLDSARLENQIDHAKKLNKEHQCLYKGQSEEDLAAVAPYLFSYESETEFAKWFTEKCWGDACGVLLSSKFPFEEVHKHFRKFLLVKTEEGEELYFRFYDPRVLRIFLPTCDKEQVLDFFGPIEYFITEGETKEEAIVFRQKNGELIVEKIPASKVFGEWAEEKTTESNILAEATGEKTPEIKQPEVLPEGKKPPRRFIY